MKNSGNLASTAFKHFMSFNAALAAAFTLALSACGGGEGGLTGTAPAVGSVSPAPTPTPSASPAPTPAPSPTNPPPIVGKAMLDCPSVAAPAYTLSTGVAALSTRYQTTCAGCHGARGEGKPGYPGIPAALSLDQFRAVIRSGKGANMPAFSAASISDADIASDFAALKAGAASTVGATNRTPPESWTAAKQEQVLARGLQLLRKPDTYGTACVNCHSPDAIELAAIAFRDDDIMRRGLQHLPADDALDIVDYVHAMRAKYKVSQPCSKLWRPFQPGGEPLPGQTVQERELAFFAVLKQNNVLLALRPIRSFADAQAASQNLEALNLRRLPIGVTFPRWSEDAFNGPQHRDFNDWMPSIGRVPKDPAAWYAQHDRYLADPSTANLAALNREVRDKTLISASDSKGRPVDLNFKVVYDAQNWIENTLLYRHQSVIAGAHFFRLALTGKPSWYELPQLPFTDLTQPLGPFFRQGMMNTEPACYGNLACATELTNRLPAVIKEEWPADKNVSEYQQGVLSDPWSYLGQLMDQTLLTGENTAGPSHDAHYWNLFTFEHRMIQQPLFSVHRLNLQQAYAAKHRGTALYPVALDNAARAARPNGQPQLSALPLATSPVLHGNWIDVQGIELLGGDVPFDDPRTGASLFLRANAALMIGYMHRDLLQRGAAVGNKQVLLQRLNQMRRPAQDIALLLNNPTLAARYPDLRDNAAVLSTGALALIGEVEALIQRASEVKDPWER